MNNSTRILTFLALLLILPIVLWLAIAWLGTKEGYASMLSAGLLLVSLVAMAWSFLLQNARLAWVALVFAVVGYLVLMLQEPLSCHAWSLSSVPQLCEGMSEPVSRNGHLRTWHLIVASYLALNGVLIAQQSSVPRIIGLNLVLTAGMLLLAMQLSP